MKTNKSNKRRTQPQHNDDDDDDGKTEKLNKNDFLDRNWCIFDLVCTERMHTIFYKLLLFVKQCVESAMRI